MGKHKRKKRFLPTRGCVKRISRDGGKNFQTCVGKDIRPNTHPILNNISSDSAPAKSASNGVSWRALFYPPTDSTATSTFSLLSFLPSFHRSYRFPSIDSIFVVPLPNCALSNPPPRADTRQHVVAPNSKQ